MSGDEHASADDGLPWIVGLPDFPALFDRTAGTIESWRTREILPPPLRVVGRSPIWLYEDIVAWAQRTGRPMPGALTARPR